MIKLGEISVNGKPVSVFTPPHDEPDFPWVDVKQLAAALLPRAAARRMVRHTQNFDKGKKRSYAVVKNGDEIAMIVCHAMAQGLCGAVDQVNGFVPQHQDDAGPAHDAYCFAFGRFAADHAPMSFEQMFSAFHHPGGPFLRGGSGA